ncbi:MAG: cell division protein FtsA [bacterium]|nr:cell division protein FtsA [bacterium]
MARNIAVGIDIGTHHVKVVVSLRTSEKNRDFPKIIGVGVSESRGLRHGYIINIADVTECIKEAVAQAEKTSKIKIKRAFISVGGVGLEAITDSGSAVVSRGDGEITELDVEKAQASARLAVPPATIVNRKVLHPIPLGYKIDGKNVFGSNPIGMKGLKLDVRMLFITCLEQHLQDLVSAVEEAGIDVEDAMASPMAASLVSLSKTQKMAGCVLTNIGAETVSVVVFENGIPVSLEVFPIGSTDITNDIALGLRVSLEEAESIKLGAITSTNYSKKDLDKIVVARLSDIFDLIEAHLKKIGRNGLLPAGIILTGGGSGIHTIEELARGALKLPSKIGSLPLSPEGKPVKDASWSVAYGLTIWGFTGDGDISGSRGELSRLGKSLWRSLHNMVRPLLP